MIESIDKTVCGKIQFLKRDSKFKRSTDDGTARWKIKRVD